MGFCALATDKELEVDKDKAKRMADDEALGRLLSRANDDTILLMN